MNVYFAHSLRSYGTAPAFQAKAAITQQWPGSTLQDPEHLDWNELVYRVGSHEAAYEHTAQNADVVAVLEHQGYVGKGVFTIVEHALRLQKPVFAFRDAKWCAVSNALLFDGGRDWKVRYAQINIGVPAGAAPARASKSADLF